MLNLLFVFFIIVIPICIILSFKIGIIKTIIITFSALFVAGLGLIILIVLLLGDSTINGEEGFNKYKSQYKSIVTLIEKDNIQNEYALPRNKKDLSNRGKVYIIRNGEELTVYFIGTTDMMDPGEIQDSIVYSSKDKEPVTGGIHFEDMYFVTGKVKRLEKGWYLLD